MSVAVGVVASEGLALTTDSRRTQMRGGPEPHFRVASDKAEKLFLVEERFAVATYGIAMIGSQTIRNLMEQFSAPPGMDLEEYARSLGEWFQAELRSETEFKRGDLMRAERLGWPLRFAVAGYESGLGRIFDVKARAGDARIEAAEPSSDNPGVVPFGQKDAIERLLKGVDPRDLKDATIRVVKDDREKLGLMSYDLILPAGVDDAVDLAEFLVSTQIEMQRFSDGTYASPKRVPGCGGELRTIAVTRRGARWIRGAGEPLTDSTRAEQLPQAAVARQPAQQSA